MANFTRKFLRLTFVILGRRACAACVAKVCPAKCLWGRPAIKPFVSKRSCDHEPRRENCIDVQFQQKKTCQLFSQLRSRSLFIFKISFILFCFCTCTKWIRIKNAEMRNIASCLPTSGLLSELCKRPFIILCISDGVIVISIINGGESERERERGREREG